MHVQNRNHDIHTHANRHHRHRRGGLTCSCTMPLVSRRMLGAAAPSPTKLSVVLILKLDWSVCRSDERERKKKLKDQRQVVVNMKKADIITQDKQRQRRAGRDNEGGQPA